MKKYARVKYCEGFIKALKDAKSFPDLRMYCSHWYYTLDPKDNTILCEVVDDVDIKTGNPKKALDIELSLFDYFFNVYGEREDKERKALWDLVNNRLDREIIKVVTL